MAEKTVGQPQGNPTPEVSPVQISPALAEEVRRQSPENRQRLAEFVRRKKGESDS